MNRREYLRYGATLGSFTLAGCSRLGLRTDEVRLAEVQIHNRSPEPEEIHIEVLRGSDSIYSDNVSLRGKDGVITPSKEVREPLNETSREWVVRATSKSFETNDSVELNVNEYVNSDCTFVGIKILGEEETLAISYSDNCSAINQ